MQRAALKGQLKGSISPLDRMDAETAFDHLIYQFMIVFHVSWQEAMDTPLSVIRKMLDHHRIEEEARAELESQARR